MGSRALLVYLIIAGHLLLVKVQANDSQAPAGAHEPRASAPRSSSSGGGGTPAPTDQLGRRRSDQPWNIPGEPGSVETEQRTLVHGSGLGSQYVRIRSPMVRYFRPRGPDAVEATELTLSPNTHAGQVVEQIKRLLIGQRLPNAAAINERLTKVKALAVLSSDAISDRKSVV